VQEIHLLLVLLKAIMVDKEITLQVVEVVVERVLVVAKVRIPQDKLPV
jgi:hypothetical protein